MPCNDLTENTEASSENAVVAKETLRDRVRGCLIGGAAGDALGYTVEFLRENEIFRTYGTEGITEYELSDGKALVSDDTQMTLFTANGLLVGETDRAAHGIHEPFCCYLAKAYRDWYLTQTESQAEALRVKACSPQEHISWLLKVSDLYALRAPGGTCLSALRGKASLTTDYVHHPVNDSKGCGGIMRVAPVALLCPDRQEDYRLLAWRGAQAAAITHGHSLGYMPAAVLTHIMRRCVAEEGPHDLKEIVLDARNTAAAMFAGDAHLAELLDIMDQAVELSENELPDLENIHRLGGGWVAEQTLGIALYCALKYRNDFSKAIIVAVNHSGDSDSTGAVAGNIVGALAGYEAIGQKWKSNLELRDVILEMADDLCTGRWPNESTYPGNLVWKAKYGGV